MTNHIFTSESVSNGHPDKVVDQISDALVDAGLANGDETTRVAVETLVTTNHVTVAGEVKNFNVDNVKDSLRCCCQNHGRELPDFPREPRSEPVWTSASRRPTMEEAEVYCRDDESTGCTIEM